MTTTNRLAKAFVALAALAVLPTAGLLATPPALAAQLNCDNNNTFPCGIQLENLGLQKVPTVFKFQARVSQAKLPIGKGTFGEVIVKLLEGDQTVCKESFQNVEVRDSVLNLEIGRNMSCELDEKIARGSSLAFQVCLGSADSCLKPIELAAVPYAVKASYAQLAQSAHTADQAAIAHYAFRAAADKDLNLLDKVSTGYFDFHSKDAANGFFLWTPVADPTAHNMTITGQNGATDTATPLDTLTFGSASTIAKGDVFIEGAQTVQGALNVAGGSHLTVTGDATIHQNLSTQQTLTVAGTTQLQQALTVSAGGVSIGADGMMVVGTATLQNELLVSGAANFQDNVQVEGHVISRGGLVLRRKTAGDQSNGFAAVELGEDDNGSPLLVIAPRTPNASVFDEVPSVHVDGPLVVNGGMHTTSTAVFDGTTEHHGAVIFRGNVDFRDATALLGLELGGGGSVSLGNYAFQGEFLSHDGIAVLRGTAGNADLQALGGVDVNGVLQATGGLNVLGAEALFSAPATFQQQATFNDTINLRLPNNQVAALFNARANGDLHLDETNVLAGLIIEVPTTFAGGNVETRFEGAIVAQSTLDVEGPLTASGWLRVGDVWRFGQSQGLQAVVAGTANNYQTVLDIVGGNKIVLNPDGKFAAVKMGGEVTASGKLYADAGLEVKHAGSTRFRVDGTQVRMLSNAQVDGSLNVNAPGGSGGLTVAGGGVVLQGNASTTHQVNGALQVNGAAQFNGGITGSGVIKAVPGSCENVNGVCPTGKWSTGMTNNSFGAFGGYAGTTRCCTMQLSN